jgi:hypothetical protein
MNFMERFIDSLHTTVKRLQSILLKHYIHFCVLGGASLSYYGFSRTTEDIDILVAREDKEKLLLIPPSYLKDKSNGRGRVFMLEGTTKIEVIYSGDILNGIKGKVYPHPKEISNNNLIDLYWLVYFKIEAQLYNKSRYGDFDDVKNLIKENNLPEDYMSKSTDDVENTYKELWKAAHVPTLFDVD